MIRVFRDPVYLYIAYQTSFQDANFHVYKWTEFMYVKYNDNTVFGLQELFSISGSGCLFLLSSLRATRPIQPIDLLLMGPSSQLSPGTC